jgi:hypothetical protein
MQKVAIVFKTVTCQERNVWGDIVKVTRKEQPELELELNHWAEALIRLSASHYEKMQVSKAYVDR